MTAESPAYTLELRQKLTLVKNRWEIVKLTFGGEQQLAYAEQKRFSLKEKVAFYVDESKAQVAFTLQARNVFDLVGTYDLKDAEGNVLATLKKDAVASLARSTYEVQTPRGTLQASERTWWRPVSRRVVGVVTDLPWMLPIQFDLKARDGRTLLTIDRKPFKLRDAYVIRVYDAEMDWRLAGGLAVATDAFMNR